MSEAQPETVAGRRMSAFEEYGARKRDEAWGAMTPGRGEQWSREMLAEMYFAACYDRRGLLLTLDSCRALAAAPLAEQRDGLDVERLARAMTADGNSDPPMWDLLGEVARDAWREKAQRIAAEYARLAPSRPAEERKP